MFAGAPLGAHGSVEKEDAFVGAVECEEKLCNLLWCSVMCEEREGLWDVD